ncbi:SDR family NAD(P)-dependent oxidoreductase [Fictibacillus terranigra]|uniref:SDR family oxidoreductase n=1 Tax=Fictibacillus terranigra TaxID=3058424 RepID=A0ABT8EDM1_9BACL|nr:SDR family oxidoreductase [Fictibacillus sp. CENA-BCM004]MDN4076015.1 SDR family oxidoreductase [Fictibacillus sp. CENA-BCM004]
MNVKDKVAVIIGGTGGIGLETATQMAKHGAKVIITGRTKDRTTTAAEEVMKREGAIIVPIHGDATCASDVENIFSKTMDQFGRVDVLVHVAGISGRKWGDGPLDECSEEGFDVVMNANLKSVYLTNHFALQVMKKQRNGSIINISSVLGLVGTQAHFTTHAYAASRGAVIAMSRSAAVYYAKDHIRINVVSPGLLDTPMSQRAINDEVIMDALTYFQPLAPHVGYPNDVAQAIMFLASDEAKFVTGITLPVDGGWTAQ